MMGQPCRVVKSICFHPVGLAKAGRLDAAGLQELPKVDVGRHQAVFTKPQRPAECKEAVGLRGKEG